MLEEATGRLSNVARPVFEGVTVLDLQRIISMVASLGDRIFEIFSFKNNKRERTSHKSLPTINCLCRSDMHDCNLAKVGDIMCCDDDD